jgi:hypothetical protein
MFNGSLYASYIPCGELYILYFLACSSHSDSFFTNSKYELELTDMELDLEAYQQHYIQNFQIHESEDDDDQVVHTWLPRICTKVVRFLTFPLKKVLAQIGIKKKEKKGPVDTPQTLGLALPSPSLLNFPELLSNEEYNIGIKTVYVVSDHKLEVRPLFVLNVPPPDRIGDSQYPATNNLYFDNLSEAQEMAMFYLAIKRNMEAARIEIDFGNSTPPILELYHHHGRNWVKGLGKISYTGWMIKG